MKKIIVLCSICITFLGNAQKLPIPPSNQKDTSVVVRDDGTIVFHFEEVRHTYDSVYLDVDSFLLSINYQPKKPELKEVLITGIAYDTTEHVAILGAWWKFEFEKRTLPITLSLIGNILHVQHVDTLPKEHVYHLWRAILCTGIYMLCIFLIIFLFGAQRSDGGISGPMHLFLSVFASIVMLAVFTTTNILPYTEPSHALFPAIGGLIALIAGMLFWQKKMKKVKTK